jgi:hypothetical protein
LQPLEWSWRNPPAGEHKLMAQATDDQGATSFSDTLVISVRRAPESTGASLVLRQPVEGSVFAPGSEVRIGLVAVDPAGDIRHVEFFANEVAIGRSDHWTKEAVIPGRPREHILTWTPAAAGVYRITAQATDTGNRTVTSKPVSILVGADTTPIVSIRATVPETSEPGPNVRVRPGYPWRTDGLSEL